MTYPVCVETCPEACKCWEESVDCSGGELTGLPQLAATTRHLVLDSNRIHVLHNICQQLPALRLTNCIGGLLAR
jgi:hypothetical protein